MTSYSPLGSPDRPWAAKGEPALLEDPALTSIAKKHKCTPAQVLISFPIQRGISVIPKTVTLSRLEENLASVKVALDEEDLKALNSFDKNFRFCLPKITLKDGTIVPREGDHPDYPFAADF